LNSSGAIRQIRSRRFEWYQWQCGSGSIGRVMVGQRWLVDFLEKKRVVEIRQWNQEWQWMGGSGGGVGVVPFEREDQGGSNGGSGNVAVAVLAELWSCKK
jgi:hypothetical protein